MLVSEDDLDDVGLQLVDEPGTSLFVIHSHIWSYFTEESMIISPASSSFINDVSMKEEDPVVDIDMMEDPAVSCSDYTQDIFLYLREAEVFKCCRVIIITLALL